MKAELLGKPRSAESPNFGVEDLPKLTASRAPSPKAAGEVDVCVKIVDTETVEASENVAVEDRGKLRPNPSPSDAVEVPGRPQPKGSPSTAVEVRGRPKPKESPNAGVDALPKPAAF